MKKNLLSIIILILISTIALSACKKEEEKEIKQGKVEINKDHIISTLIEPVNQKLTKTRGFELSTYKEKLSSENLYSELKVNKKDNFIYLNNSYNGGKEEYYANFHYIKEKSQWFFDLKEKEDKEYYITHYLPLIENNYKKELLDDENINELECYSLKITIPEIQEDIIYYVEKENLDLIGYKKENLITLIQFNCYFEKEDGLNSAIRKQQN